MTPIRARSYEIFRRNAHRQPVGGLVLLTTFLTTRALGTISLLQDFHHSAFSQPGSQGFGRGTVHSRAVPAETRETYEGQGRETDRGLAGQDCRSTQSHGHLKNKRLISINRSRSRNWTSLARKERFMMPSTTGRAANSSSWTKRVK